MGDRKRWKERGSREVQRVKWNGMRGEGERVRRTGGERESEGSEHTRAMSHTW